MYVIRRLGQGERALFTVVWVQKQHFTSLSKTTSKTPNFKHGHLRKDSDDHVFKYLAPHNIGRLECMFIRELVFVPAGGGDALLRMVAGRRHVEAAKKGAKMLVPLGEEREGRIT